MKIINTIKYSNHKADVLFFAGFYKIQINEIVLNDLYNTRKDTENAIFTIARKYLGIEVK